MKVGVVVLGTRRSCSDGDDFKKCKGMTRMEKMIMRRRRRKRNTYEEVQITAPISRITSDSNAEQCE
jgi:hypothetical protein